jgi:hypothetical protein
MLVKVLFLQLSTFPFGDCEVLRFLYPYEILHVSQNENYDFTNSKTSFGPSGKLLKNLASGGFEHAERLSGHLTPPSGT